MKIGKLEFGWWDVWQALFICGSMFAFGYIFGYASLFGDHNDEWGYMSLKEFEDLKLPFGLGIERDIHFSPKPIKECNIPTLRD